MYSVSAANTNASLDTICTLLSTVSSQSASLGQAVSESTDVVQEWEERLKVNDAEYSKLCILATNDLQGTYSTTMSGI